MKGKEARPRVDLKESTKSVGNLRIKPTVSDSRNGRFSIITLRTVVSNVANSLFSGIGTHIFDVGVFVSSENWKFGGIGCKFTFELFNR